MNEKVRKFGLIGSTEGVSVDPTILQLNVNLIRELSSANVRAPKLEDSPTAVGYIMTRKINVK